MQCQWANGSLLYMMKLEAKVQANFMVQSLPNQYLNHQWSINSRSQVSDKIRSLPNKSTNWVNKSMRSWALEFPCSSGPVFIQPIKQNRQANSMTTDRQGKDVDVLATKFSVGSINTDTTLFSCYKAHQYASDQPIIQFIVGKESRTRPFTL